MNYLGIDVAKLKLDVCLLQGQRKRLKALSNCPEGFAKLLAWCKAQDLAALTPPAIMASIDRHIGFLEGQLKDMDGDIDAHIEANPTLKADRALLQSIPGIGPRVSALMVALLRGHCFTCRRTHRS